ncbi:MAG: hypothetical protein GXO49_07965 [Chlorobi bacterium]|nr:hypothetical protein [Chlorobiota bacterium]
MKIIKLILIGVFITSSFISCNNDEEFAPELPPKESFVLDFSDFESKVSDDITKLNWTHASSNVLIWNTILTVGLAVPIASYNEAVKNHEPIYQGNDTWLWEFSFSNNLDQYTAKLFGTVNDNSIYWEMFISKDGEFNNFKWYSGTSLLDNSKVSWVLYNNPNEATELLSVEYIKTSDNTANITFTNIEPDGAENGGFIKFGNDSETFFNNYYQIYNKGLDNLINVEWSQSDKSGRVIDELWYKDTDWHCWNENKEDIECDF